MQRCFTTFPDHWPGIGLLILRLTLAAIPIAQVARLWDGSWTLTTTVLFGLEAGCAGLLLFGLLTPIAAALIALVECAMFLSTYDRVHLLVATLGLVVLMLGPGVWSVDSRLFGRRRIHIEGLGHPP